MSFLNSFVKMMRTKTEETINEFYKASKLLFNSTKTKERDLILPVLQSENQITDILERVSKYTIDLTLSSFYILCDLWYKKVNKKLNIFQRMSFLTSFQIFNLVGRRILKNILVKKKR